MMYYNNNMYVILDLIINYKSHIFLSKMNDNNLIITYQYEVYVWILSKYLLDK
jgi:hypothetical protein